MPRDLLAPQAPQQAQPRDLLEGRQAPQKPWLSRTASSYGDFLSTLAKKPGQLLPAMAETALSAGTGMVAAPVNDFWNAAMEAGGFPTKDMMSAYQPRTELGQSMVRAGSDLMSPVAAGVDYMTDINNPDPAVRATGRVIRGTLGVLPLVGAKGLPKRGPAPTKAAPKTAADLRTEANAAYAKADELGRGEIIRQESLGNFTNKVERSLADDAFDPDLEPMTAFSLNKLMEESTRPGVAGHSPQGLEVLRRKLLKAEGNAARAGNANDARQVAKIIDDFDDYADNLVQGQDVIGSGGTAASIAARTEARALWARMKKTQTIEDLIERAKTSSPALTQTGLENALRLQFKSLALNARRMRQFSAEERAAIERVAKGTRAQQFARRVAGLAPRGAVSGAAATVIGGATGGGALPIIAVGEAGALAARLMRLGDVEAARTLISTGQGATQAARPTLAGPTEAAVRASTLIPPALSAETIDRQRNALYRNERPRNALAR